MNKKYFLFIGIGILIILFISLLIFGKNEDNSVVLLNMTKLQEKIKNKDTFVLVITQDGCSHCKNYEPIMDTVSQKYNISLYNLNLTTLSSNEYAELKKIANINSTPTTLFFVDGEEESTLNRLIGETSETKLVEKLKKLGYIKE